MQVPKSKKDVPISLILCLMQLFLFVGCARYSKEIYKGYTGSVQSVDSVVTIILENRVDWFNTGDIHIKHKDYGRILLQTGTHTIEWGTRFSVSMLIKASGQDDRTWSTSLNFEPGHTYSIHSDRTTGHGYQVFSWIIDETVGEIVWGKKKP